LRQIRPLAVCALALTATACSESANHKTSSGAIDAGGTTIPAAKTTSAPTAPTITTASGAPKVVEFAAPHSFWCLEAHAGQAQVTLGWSVPSATTVAVLLDGRRVHTGIRKALPFWLPAGKAAGIGGTIVFRCRSQNRHRVTVHWRMRRSAIETRTVAIRKAVR
jgi:hypothetical protein